MRARAGKRSIAADVSRLLLDFAMAQFARNAEAVRPMGLTPGHVKALLSLDPDHPEPMGSLAERFACDASTMTWLVDRLEERGLVERRGLPNDRRVKTVALTALGVQTRTELESRMFDPPAELLALDQATLVVLRNALRGMKPEAGIR